MENTPDDPNSFSRPLECVTTNMDLVIDVDFSAQCVRGTVSYTCKKASAGADVLVLDTDEISIFRIYSDQTTENLGFKTHDAVKPFGSKLEVFLPPSLEDEFEISIDFQNSPTAGGLQWLSAEQTAGKRHPYMFSQFQAIYARSFLPCQDTPLVKLPYRAKVTVNKELTVLMSAVPQGSSVTSGDRVTYEFYQKIPIPCYLLAIAVGDLTHKVIGPRSKVWTEKEMVDAAAYEFAETEMMLAKSEELCGPYVWGVYDLLVLPPTFPYGGMENPCLTFVTPTLLAGDRSATSTVAHEIAHSWTGNLVTNRDWQHFWLNEGHTVFVERKVIGRLYGEQHRQFASIGGWTGLLEAVGTFGAGHEFTKLVPNLTNSHPDEAFSRVPYEKGSALLLTVEQALGGADVFEPWLKAYIQRFSGKSITTKEWLKFLYEFFQDKHELLNQIDWQAWLYSPGMPPTQPKYDRTLFTDCERLSNRWIQGDFPADRKDFDNFSTNQKTEFLANLLLQDSLAPDTVRKLGTLYDLPSIKNYEIKYRWLQLCLKACMTDHLEVTLQFVTDAGRMKHVRPIYKELYRFEAVRDLAIQTFQRNRPYMHKITAKMVADDLHLPE